LVSCYGNSLIISVIKYPSDIADNIFINIVTKILTPLYLATIKYRLIQIAQNNDINLIVSIFLLV
jgi:hypothetical protein